MRATIVMLVDKRFQIRANGNLPFLLNGVIGQGDGVL